MLSILKLILKLTIFSAIVLVLGSLVKWNGRTVSDQIKTRLSHAERLPAATGLDETVKDWGGRISRATSDLAHDAREGSRRGTRPGTSSQLAAPSQAPASAQPAQGKQVARGETASEMDEGKTEDIRVSERQKLKALIRELNSQDR